MWVDQKLKFVCAIMHVNTEEDSRLTAHLFKIHI